MSSRFRILGSPGFEREFRNIAEANSQLPAALEELLVILRNDPHNRSGQHNIKKLAQVKAGDGQWRIRWRDYRLRYDIYAGEVVLFSFRHRKESY
jgi:mRNA-degrading endonuclease RelE of RelBE toxin-antitoxin system